jgi:NAD+ kinase
LRVGIVARPEIPGVLKLVRKVLGLLAKEEVLLEQKLARKLGKRGAAVQTLRKADAIVTIGGDGTVLFAQQLAPGVPTLGINIGGRGFLAEVKPGEAQRALRMLVVGKLPIIERGRLAGEVAGKRLPDALNDAVVCTAKLGKTISLRVSVDGKVAMDMRGDGVIVATTTGSTAYALAAGGPAIDPRLPAFVVVPVCPSHPRVHPLIVPTDSRIDVKPTRPEREGLVIVDGRLAAKIRYGAKLAFYRSPKPARFFGWGEFYRKLREKL